MQINPLSHDRIEKLRYRMKNGLFASAVRKQDTLAGIENAATVSVFISSLQALLAESLGAVPEIKRRVRIVWNLD
jgi:hypothetical protein